MKQKIPILDLIYSGKDYTTGKTRIGSYFGKLAERLLDALKDAGLYESDLHYRGFNSKRLSKLLKTGTDRYEDEKEITYATIEGDGNENYRNTPDEKKWTLESAIDYALHKRKKGWISKILGNEGQFTVAVYRGENLQVDFSYLGRYKLKQDKKPIAIVRFSREKRSESN